MNKPNPLALNLADGTRVALPNLPDLVEFALPGNSRPFNQFLAVYDETTETAGLYYFETHIWHLHQPATRELFFAQCELLDSLTPSQEAAVAFAGTAPAHVTKH